MRGTKEMQLKGRTAPKSQGTFTPNLIQEQNFNQDSFLKLGENFEREKFKKIRKKKLNSKVVFSNKIYSESNKTKLGFSEQAGITLIALIITIIVMIILASVSINAIVGDNGIITQAQNATIQNSIANLEEYLQELYVENYDAVANSSYESKLEALAGITSYKYYFYNPSRDSSVGALSYISTSDGYVLYLINKSQLPLEIQELLVGGDAGDGEYSDYASLNDVYGVTKDLKVYYCSGGIDTITGIASTELDTDNLQRVVFTLTDNSAWYNLLSTYDTNSNEELTVQELRSVKTLTISSSDGISSLSELYNLTSLQELTLDSLEIDNIDGIENVVQLYYVYFEGCIIGDYTALCDVSNLTYLYFYDINDEELETACIDIATAEFSKLTYLAVVGNSSYISFTIFDPSNRILTSSDKSNKTITTLEPLSWLSDVTKSAVKYLSIQNNNIKEDLSYISEYTNLILLRCEYNSITSLNGLDEMQNLVYLCGANNNIGTELVEGEEYTVDTSIASLENKLNLVQVCLINNQNLINVDYLQNDVEIRYLYLSGCSGDMNVNKISDIILGCGSCYSLPVKFVYGSNYYVLDYYDSASSASYDDLWNDLYNNKYVTKLNLQGTTLTNDQYQEILASMPNLKYLRLRNCSNLSSLEFISSSGTSQLIVLDIWGTSVTDLSNLNYISETLQSLAVNNSSIDLNSIINLINNMTYSGWCFKDSSYMTDYYMAGITAPSSMIEKLNGNESLTYIGCSWYTNSDSITSDVDLSQCSNLSSVNFIGTRNYSVVLPSSIKKVECLDYATVIFSANTVGPVECSFNNPSSYMSQRVCDSFSNVSLFSSLDLYSYNSSQPFVVCDGEVNCEILTVRGAMNYYSSYAKEWDIGGLINWINPSSELYVYYISNPQNLDDINISSTCETVDFYKIGTATSSFISNFSNVTYLRMRYTSITDIYALRNLSYLAKLDLRDNSLYDSIDVYADNQIVECNNLQILIDLHENESLRTLYISGNNFTISSTNSDYQTLIGLNWTASDF